MQIDKALKLILIFLMVISALALFTPLTFTNIWARNVCFILTILLSIVMGLRMKKSKLKYILIFVPISIFIIVQLLSYNNSLANRNTDKWRTAWISHRKGGKYIAGQMLDVGGRGYANRVVEIIPLTPLFEWTTKTDTSTLDNTWIRTAESYNPYNLK